MGKHGTLWYCMDLMTFYGFSNEHESGSWLMDIIVLKTWETGNYCSFHEWMMMLASSNSRTKHVSGNQKQTHSGVVSEIEWKYDQQFILRPFFHTISWLILTRKMPRSSAHSADLMCHFSTSSTNQTDIQQVTTYIDAINSIHYWLVVSTTLKNISQLGWFFPLYGKMKYVPSHQPVQC